MKSSKFIRSSIEKKRNARLNRASLKTENYVNRFYKSFNKTINKEEESTPKLKEYHEVYEKNSELMQRVIKLESEKNVLELKLQSFETSVLSIQNNKKIKKLKEFVKILDQELNKAPEIEKTIIKRFNNSKKLINSLAKPNSNALLKCVQIISDLVRKENYDSKYKRPNKIVYDYNHSESVRLEKLNKEISENMFTSTQLLFSPLSTKLEE